MAGKPRVWTLLGQKAGDNNQVLALAESLGFGWEEKHLRYISLELIPNRLLGVTLKGITNRVEADLVPPWPDLVISAGRRNEPVARWIRKMAGQQCRLVHMGRPWAHPRHFDLIVTTPQYNLEPAANILVNELPLHRVNKVSLAQAKTEWQDVLAHLPRPWTALFVGGNSSTVQFTAASLARLAELADELARDSGGSLLITTSARTPKGCMPIIQNRVTVPAWFHDYEADLNDNPYHAYLAMADRFIVTAESISMLTESCFMNKPVHVFDPARPEHRGDKTNPPTEPIVTDRPGRAAGTWLRDNFGPRRLRRDISRIHRALAQDKRILWLGQDESEWSGSPESSDLERATERVLSLLKVGR